MGRSPGGGNGNLYSCLENPRGQRSLADHSPESYMTECLSTQSCFTLSSIQVYVFEHFTLKIKNKYFSSFSNYKVHNARSIHSQSIIFKKIAKIHKCLLYDRNFPKYFTCFIYLFFCLLSFFSIYFYFLNFFKRIIYLFI